jgi:hypothetical protein
MLHELHDPQSASVLQLLDEVEFPPLLLLLLESNAQ